MNFGNSAQMLYVREAHRIDTVSAIVCTSVLLAPRRLHEYNEIKDVGQALLGMLAQMAGGGTTTKDLYEVYGLEFDD